ncbi:MAG: hypothetical protein WCI36_02890 [bacterium]
MSQTFYIDLEEEISSVVDRLNKSISTDNFFVLPKRAIFLQSIVNLKLLKREAEKVGKRIVIVTQDEIGASMAKRCEIEVRSVMEEAVAMQNVEQVQVFEEELPEVEYQPPLQQKKQTRLSEIGSNNFYDAGMQNKKQEVGFAPAPVPQQKSIKASGDFLGLKRADSLQREKLPSRINIMQPVAKPMLGGLKKSTMALYDNKLNNEKEKALEKLYSSHDKPQKKTGSEIVPMDGKVKSIFIIFTVLCFFAFVGVGLYLYLPTAKISVEPNIIKSKTDLSLTANTEIAKVEGSKLPLRIIDKEETQTFPYETKGVGTTSGKKAHGSLAIFNEYDSSAQTLVASTRFESSDGKIFRLNKNVIVPGSTTVDGQVRAGSVVAEVTADQAGSSFNIDAASFSIPGFKDSPKFAKFSAKSTEKMIGGGDDGGAAAGVVTQQDLDSAKQKAQTAMKEKILESINVDLKDKEVSLSQAQQVIISKTTTTARIGDTLGTFNYVVTASARALVFSEGDVRKAVDGSIALDAQNKDNKRDISKIEYGTADADFEKNTLDLKVHAEITDTPNIKTDEIKGQILGKNDEQLGVFLKKYSTIKNVNIEFWPTFISRIPQYGQRVTVEIKK